MISDSTKADQTYTVEQFIDMRSSDEITYYNTSILQYLNGFEYSITNVLYDYDDELIENTVNLRLSDIEFIKYKYKPWLLAYDIYGSEESGFIIKILNGILADSEFDFKKVKVLLPSVLVTFMGRILSANDLYINNNRADVRKEEKNKENTLW